jgi:AraC family transcriptional regulator
VSTTQHILAAAPGWRVSDVVCTSGPRDRPFEERHETSCIAAVAEGTFQYRSAKGGAVMTPGAILLGNAGDCFECGHEHGMGDRCLSFHFTPDYLEEIIAAVPGVRRMEFSAPRLPPLPLTVPLLAAAEAARDQGDGALLEELGLRLAGAVAMALAGAGPIARAPSRDHRERITEAVRRIEAHADQRLTLSALAYNAGMSPYHFLRSFRHVVGITPYQFVLRIRLHRAAVLLRRTDQPVSAIAFDAGFNDLSTFNHRFRRAMGDNPSIYRTRHCLGLGTQ